MEEYDELFGLLPVEAQQTIARGDVTLEDLLERVTSSEGAELCPHCARRPIRHPRLGLCTACARRSLADAHNEAYAELEAQREYDVAKQRLKRVREELGVTAPRQRNRPATSP
ncbi:hypothetical protein [Anaerosoma tenue]|uniref:hypothetical protein n=1 Tax=Anaerosoma tenue TaxID=2933588 RepID=UPI002260863B|nr:hypothetical protein [Anaerosoma tenue]MCK8113972.1 hypothetical protein [Anaerosoma tenue]